MRVLKQSFLFGQGNSIVNVMRKVSSLKKTERFDDNQIKQLRDKRLRLLLQHVLTNSRFYRDYYQAQGIGIDKVDKVSLQDLPPINKNMMMENFDDFVCNPLLRREKLEQFISDPINRGKKYEGKFQIIHTSGSTGRVGIFVYGPEEWDLLRALVVARVAKTSFSLLRRRRIAFIGATEGHYAGISLAQETGRLFANFLPLSISRPRQEIIQKINVFQPETLTGYASAINLLAQEQLKKNITICPHRIFCFADHLTSTMRDNIKAAFGIDPVNLYGASESISMAVQYSSKEGFHLFDDWHYFEVVDKDYNPVAPGKPGILLLTNLYNYTQPLIRYQINDEIILDETTDKGRRPCSCIKNIAGRQEDFLWFQKEDGAKEYIHPLVIVELFAPGLEKFQVIQTQPDRLLIKAVVQANSDAALAVLREKIYDILKKKQLDNNVSVDFEVVDEIANDPKTGKFKLIISYNE